MIRRPRTVLAVFAVASASLLVYAAPHLGINSSEEALFAGSTQYVALREAFREEFPALVDPVLVVIDGDTVDLAQDTAESLRARLLEQPDRFPNVYLPGGGPFFETHGLLYLEPEELEDTLDRLAEIQPYLGTLARDGSLRGLFGLLQQAAAAVGSGDLQLSELGEVFDEIDASVRAVSAGRHRDLSWTQLLLGPPTSASDLRRVLIVQPVVDFGALEPAKGTLDGLREAIAELGLDRDPGVRVRLTGLFPLSEEESHYVTAQAGVAGIASLALVSLVMLGGLRSGRLVLWIVVSLLAGLALTAGFAALSIGHLNLISVAFTVLFIGLGVDFGIHLGVRYQNLRAERLDRAAALRGAAERVGGSLVLCASTTAVAFYAFTPTDFRGIAELGVIAGTGMFFALFANLTLLPALLVLGREPERPEPREVPARVARWIELPLRHARAVAVGTALLAAGALAILPRVSFDLNPLRVRDPNTESVQALNDLLADGMAFPWNIHALAESREAADALAARLEALDTVDEALAPSEYVPKDQAEKLEMLGDAAFLLLPTLEPPDTLPPPTPAEELAAITSLEEELGRLAASRAPPALAESGARLRASLARFRSGVDQGGERRLEELDHSLLQSLPRQLRVLRSALRAGPVTWDDLPENLRRQLVAPDGRVRVEIFPKEDLNDNAALARYVESVGEVAPVAYGEGIAIYEIGGIVVRAFQESLALAGVAILVLLFLLWRSVVDTALVALPLALAAVFTAASSVLLGVPFNFANVIVIPRLAGLGVDSGIHLVHRLRHEGAPEANLLRTDTALAVLLSGLTTIASFCTLGFASHMGLASLGRLLTLGMVWILLCNLVVLPVAVSLARPAKPPRGD